MCVGKKAAGKKNKFWVGRFSFMRFFSSALFEETLIFVTNLGALHITEKVLAKCGLNWTKSGKKNHLEQNIFPLTKLQKNRKWKNFLRLLLT